MDYSLKCRCKTIELLEKRKHLGCRARQKILRLDIKSIIHKRKKIEPHQNLKLLLCESPYEGDEKTRYPIK